MTLFKTVDGEYLNVTFIEFIQGNIVYTANECRYTMKPEDISRLLTLVEVI